MVSIFIRKLRRFIYLLQIQTWLWKVFGYKKEAFECDIIVKNL